MCRSIKTLRTEPEWDHDDTHAAALQYVRKLSGYRQPSKKNEEAFNEAVNEIAHITEHLLQKLA